MAPASSATVPRGIWTALNPRRKSASEFAVYRSVGWCQYGFDPLPISATRWLSRTLTVAV